MRVLMLVLTLGLCACGGATTEPMRPLQPGACADCTTAPTLPVVLDTHLTPRNR